MKVLILMTQIHRLCGAERLAVELAESLNKRGIRADIMSMYTEDLPGAADGRARLHESGIPTVGFLGLQVHPRIQSLLVAASRLRKTILEGGYDAVETSSLTPHIIAVLATWKTKVRLIHGIHSVFDSDVHTGIRYAAWRMIVRMSQRTHYYAVSESARSHWIRFSSVPSDRVHMIYNCINDEFFDVARDGDYLRNQLRIESGGRLLISVGRLNKIKGIDTVYEALRGILDRENLYLLYIGGEEDAETFYPDGKGIVDRLRRLIAEDNLGGRVFFLGHRRDVPRIMASADLLVHPARREAFGLVLVEAMAAGLPLVTSDVGGIPEAVSGTDSIMVGAEDPIGLRQAVLEALGRSGPVVARVVEKGRTRAGDFRMSKRVDSLVELFKPSPGEGIRSDLEK